MIQANKHDFITNYCFFNIISMIFVVPGDLLGGQNGVENGVQNVASTLKAPESLLNGSWSALEVSSVVKKVSSLVNK